MDMSDLQTPIEAILSACESLLTSASEDHPLTADQKKFIEIIRENARRSTEQFTEYADKIEIMKSGQQYFSIAHDLRQPLVSIIGFSEILAAGMVGEMDERQTSSVQTIARWGNDLLLTLNQIVDRARHSDDRPTLIS
jgi:signal transduction histidine kinase